MNKKVLISIFIVITIIILILIYKFGNKQNYIQLKRIKYSTLPRNKINNNNNNNNYIIESYEFKKNGIENFTDDDNSKIEKLKNSLIGRCYYIPDMNIKNIQSFSGTGSFILNDKIKVEKLVDGKVVDDVVDMLSIDNTNISYTDQNSYMNADTSYDKNLKDIVVKANNSISQNDPFYISMINMNKTVGEIINLNENINELIQKSNNKFVGYNFNVQKENNTIGFQKNIFKEEFLNNEFLTDLLILSTSESGVIKDIKDDPNQPIDYTYIKRDINSESQKNPNNMHINNNDFEPYRNFLKKWGSHFIIDETYGKKIDIFETYNSILCPEDKNTTNINDACVKRIWKNSGCTTEPANNLETLKDKTEQWFIDDSNNWANMTDDLHREGCYGPDKKYWPINTNSTNQINVINQKTYWGEGIAGNIDNNNTNDINTCKQYCIDNPECSGATFNPTKNSCWLRKGNSAITDGASDDYALIREKTCPTELNATGISYDCSKELWKNSGCTTDPINNTDAMNNLSDKTKQWFIDDYKSRATLLDDEHRTACYGPDKSKWPKIKILPTDDFGRLIEIKHCLLRYSISNMDFKIDKTGCPYSLEEIYKSEFLDTSKSINVLGGTEEDRKSLIRNDEYNLTINSDNLKNFLSDKVSDTKIYFSFIPIWEILINIYSIDCGEYVFGDYLYKIKSLQNNCTGIVLDEVYKMELITKYLDYLVDDLKIEIRFSAINETINLLKTKKLGFVNIQKFNLYPTLNKIDIGEIRNNMYLNSIKITGKLDDNLPGNGYNISKMLDKIIENNTKLLTLPKNFIYTMVVGNYNYIKNTVPINIVGMNQYNEYTDFKFKLLESKFMAKSDNININISFTLTIDIDNKSTKLNFKGEFNVYSSYISLLNPYINGEKILYKQFRIKNEDTEYKNLNINSNNTQTILIGNIKEGGIIKKIKLRGIFNTSQINNDSYLKLKIGNWDSSNDNQKILLKQNDSILHSGDIITLKNVNYTPECENNNIMLLNSNTMKVTTNKNYLTCKDNYLSNSDISNDCINTIWEKAGCKLPIKNDIYENYKNKIGQDIINDINVLSNTNNVGCYGDDISSLPMCPVDKNTTNISSSCNKKIWKNAGCTTEPKNNLETLKDKTHQWFIDDSNKWANMTDDLHREGCYGTDKSKWPYSQWIIKKDDNTDIKDGDIVTITSPFLDDDNFLTGCVNGNNVYMSKNCQITDCNKWKIRKMDKTFTVLKKYKGKTFWGTGVYGDVEGRNLENIEECNILCKDNIECSGATFNPKKKTCWLRKGASGITDGSDDDYAIIKETYTKTIYTLESLSKECQNNMNFLTGCNNTLEIQTTATCAQNECSSWELNITPQKEINYVLNLDNIIYVNTNDEIYIEGVNLTNFSIDNFNINIEVDYPELAKIGDIKIPVPFIANIYEKNSEHFFEYNYKLTNFSTNIDDRVNINSKLLINYFSKDTINIPTTTPFPTTTSAPTSTYPPGKFYLKWITSQPNNLILDTKETYPNNNIISSEKRVQPYKLSAGTYKFKILSVTNDSSDKVEITLIDDSDNLITTLVYQGQFNPFSTLTNYEPCLPWGPCTFKLEKDTNVRVKYSNNYYQNTTGITILITLMTNESFKDLKDVQKESFNYLLDKFSNKLNNENVTKDILNFVFNNIKEGKVYCDNNNKCDFSPEIQTLLDSYSYPSNTPLIPPYIKPSTTTLQPTTSIQPNIYNISDIIIEISGFIDSIKDGTEYEQANKFCNYTNKRSEIIYTRVKIPYSEPVYIDKNNIKYYNVIYVDESDPNNIRNVIELYVTESDIYKTYEPCQMLQAAYNLQAAYYNTGDLLCKYTDSKYGVIQKLVSTKRIASEKNSLRIYGCWNRATGCQSNADCTGTTLDIHYPGEEFIYGRGWGRVPGTYGRGWGRIPDKKPCDNDERDDGTSCWLDTYGRGVGSSAVHIYGKGCCCTAWGCCHNCPPGYTDDGCTCRKDSCSADEEWSASMCYPRCKPGYESVGCCLCQPHGGPRITKTAFDRYQCRDDEERWGALCYPKCKPGYHNVLSNICQEDCRPDEDRVGELCYPRCRHGYHATTANICQRDEGFHGEDRIDYCPQNDGLFHVVNQDYILKDGEYRTVINRPSELPPNGSGRTGQYSCASNTGRLNNEGLIIRNTGQTGILESCECQNPYTIPGKINQPASAVANLLEDRLIWRQTDFK